MNALPSKRRMPWPEAVELEAIATETNADADTEAALVPFASYLALSAREAAQPAHWRHATLESGCRRLAHGERGTVALVPRGQAGRHGEIAPGLSMTLQIVRPGEVTSAHRHAFWHLYVVLDGRGLARVETGRPRANTADAVGKIDSTDSLLTRGDVLYVPPWASHRLENPHADDALLLYVVQNLPQLAALGTLMRETPEGGVEHIYRHASPLKEANGAR